MGILLRARKHKLVEFEGEMLFQRRDDDVPIFLIKPVAEIRRDMNEKIESIKRAGSPAPQSTSVLLDKKAHGLSVPSSRKSVSRTPSPQTSKSGSPVKETKAPAAAAPVAAADVASALAPASANTPAPAPTPVATHVENPKIQISGEPEPVTAKPPTPQPQQTQAQPEFKETVSEVAVTTEAKAETAQEVAENPTVESTQTQAQTAEQPEAPAVDTTDDLPTVIVEASAVYVSSPATADVNANPAPEAAVA